MSYKTIIILLVWFSDLQARPFYNTTQIPNANAFGCALCHYYPEGGGPRNPFGQTVENGTFISIRNIIQWGPNLAQIDSDRDGYTNGLELGDPNGNFISLTKDLSHPGDATKYPQEQSPNAPLPPIVQIASTILKFDSLHVGNTQTLTLTAYNIQGIALTLLISLTDSHFVAPSDTLFISSGDFLKIPIQFKPNHPISYQAELTITTNDPISPHITIKLQGVGTILQADFDHDGCVGFSDFLLFAAAFDSAQAKFDLNADGHVNFSDFLVFVSYFGHK